MGTMTHHRFLPVLLMVAPLIIGSQAAATVRPLSLAVSDDGGVRGVLTDHGVWVQVDQRWHWVCDKASGIDELGATGILAVGAERLLLHGASGVIVSEAESACQWRAMAGSAGIRPVIAAHAVEPGGLVVAFALGGDDLRKVAVTDDGGATSTTLDGLALAEHEVLGMVGQGAGLVVAAQHTTTAEIGLWRSEDLGNQWTAREFLPGYASFVPVALSRDGRIGVVRGRDIGVYADGGWTSLTTATEAVALFSSQADRALVAFGGAVHELDLEAAILKPVVGADWTGAAFVDGGYVLGAAVGGLGEPFAYEATQQGTLDAVAVVPDPVSHAPLCESAMGSMCRTSRPTLDAALGIVTPEPSTEPAPQAPKAACSAAENTPLWTVLGAWLFLLARSRLRHAS